MRGGEGIRGIFCSVVDHFFLLGKIFMEQGIVSATANLALNSSITGAGSLQAAHGQTQLFCSCMSLVNIKLAVCFAEIETVLPQARAEVSILTFWEKDREQTGGQAEWQTKY